MKKIGLILLSVIFLVYGYLGYDTVRTYMQYDVTVKTSARLSDIAGKVVSVPLETPGNGVIRQIRRVQADGDCLFMLSDQRLLQFDFSGKFIRQLTASAHDSEVFIADYTLDTDRRLVVIIDSQRNCHNYDYYGNLLSTSRLEQPWRKLTAFAYHNRTFWVTAEKLVKSRENPDEFQIIHSLYQLDANMHEIASQRLHVADVGRNRVFESYHADELLADDYGVYAYASPGNMDYLLHDTLYITHRQEIPLLHTGGHFGSACIYPVRKGKRYQIATNHQAIDDHYSFFYDRIDHTAYCLSKGFKDDLHKTGYVADLQPMDIHNHSYCYLKSGAELSKKFPDRAKNNDSPVLFIVTLKT